MIDPASLLILSFKTERAASRRLALRSGMPEDEALRQTLEMRAGQQGLAALLAQRAASRQTAQQRAAERVTAAASSAARATAGSPDTPWRAWFDGSAHPNPGRCGIGALLLGPAGQRVDIALAAGYGNSNEAEYRALIAVLQAAIAAQAHGLTVFGDSRVVIDDVQAPAHRAAASLLAYRDQVHTLLGQLRDVSLRWIPRHRNSAADALSQQGSALHHAAADGS